MTNNNSDIWAHYDGYYESRQRILAQSTEADLEFIDNLFSRRFIPVDATPDQIKHEALRQHEIEWRDYKKAWGCA